MLPAEFSDCYDAEHYAQSQRYLAENTRFAAVTDTCMTFLTVTFICIGGFGRLNDAIRGLGLNDVATGLLFAGALGLAWQLVSLPFSAYDTFVIEEKYGFNKTTLKTFFLDMIKGWLLVIVIGAPVFALVQLVDIPALDRRYIRISLRIGGMQ